MNVLLPLGRKQRCYFLVLFTLLTLCTLLIAMICCLQLNTFGWNAGYIHYRWSAFCASISPTCEVLPRCQSVGQMAFLTSQGICKWWLKMLLPSCLVIFSSQTFWLLFSVCAGHSRGWAQRRNAYLQASLAVLSRSFTLAWSTSRRMESPLVKGCLLGLGPTGRWCRTPPSATSARARRPGETVRYLPYVFHTKRIRAPNKFAT